MQSDILERIRVLEADIERRRDAIVEQQLLPIENQRHSLMRDRFVAEQSRHLSDSATQLLDLYLDGDDLPAIQDEEMPLEAMMTFFNARVASIREYYRTHPNADGDIEEPTIEPDVDALIENGVFHQNEKYGTRLCLDEHHLAFERFLVQCGRAAELRNSAKILRDTFASLDKFMFNPTLALAKTPQKLKLAEKDKYLSFLSDLKDYLVGFFERAKPLQTSQLKDQLKQAQEGFADYWRQVEAAFLMSGGEEAAINKVHQTSSPAFTASIVQRPSPFLISPWDLRTVPASEDREAAKKIALLEAEIAIICLPPSGVLSALLRSSAESHQEDRSKMLAERRREEEAAEESFLDSLEQAEERLKVMRSKTAPKVAGEDFDLELLNLGAATTTTAVNKNAPTNAPTASASSGGAFPRRGGGGPRGNNTLLISGDTDTAALAEKVDLLESKALLDSDGNPLPAWQVRLEGRRKTFVCEVCAGAVYHGPKEWREHFRFFRHTEGLRLLGIINTHDFDGISTIRGAQQLQEQLKIKQGSNLLRRIAEERLWGEIEDERGMVLRRGDYEKMKRR